MTLEEYVLEQRKNGKRGTATQLAERLGCNVNTLPKPDWDDDDEDDEDEPTPPPPAMASPVVGMAPVKPPAAPTPAPAPPMAPGPRLAANDDDNGSTLLDAASEEDLRDFIGFCKLEKRAEHFLGVAAYLRAKAG